MLTEECTVVMWTTRDMFNMFSTLSLSWVNISTIINTGKYSVSEPPTIAKQPRQDVVEVMVGDTVVLRCAASGHPNPGITWYKHGDNTSHDQDDVISRGLSVDVLVDHDDEGEVVCEADNGVSPPVKESFYIVPVCKNKSSLISVFFLQS